MTTDQLLFFDNIRKDENIGRAIRIVSAVRDDTNILHDEVEPEYYELQRNLLRSVRYGAPQLTFWQNYLLQLVASSENEFSLMAEKGMNDLLLEQFAEGDLIVIRKLLEIDWKQIIAWMDDKRMCVCDTRSSSIKEDRRIMELYQSFSGPSETMAQDISSFYRNNMCGSFGKYSVFVWDGELRGIEDPDSVTFEDLIGYKTQQEQLIKNTEMFLEGRRANNVLLYGDKGTGKSSSVKALVNQFSDRGLRMISLPKDRIMDITKVMNRVADRGCRFLIFIDDLSFEATEIEYKKFKSVLEGDVSVRPENVLVYVTSNRRNLVRELWSDRGDPQEVHSRDGVQETQSLADRFGLTITFSSPEKKLFNEMVLAIAEREGVEIDQETLLREANKWDMRQTSRSGRSARQFITHISGRELENNWKTVGFVRRT